MSRNHDRHRHRARRSLLLVLVALVATTTVTITGCSSGGGDSSNGDGGTSTTEVSREAGIFTDEVYVTIRNDTQKSMPVDIVSSYTNRGFRYVGQYAATQMISGPGYDKAVAKLPLPNGEVTIEVANPLVYEPSVTINGVGPMSIPRSGQLDLSPWANRGQSVSITQQPSKDGFKYFTVTIGW